MPPSGVPVLGPTIRRNGIEVQATPVASGTLGDLGFATSPHANRADQQAAMCP
ncbi:hypothetical protein [Roseicyclus sp.]|uniref:hypothetical protein n=1 Tax=Roseicyclus sp. TaxID=1914329 RepID=UPI001BCA7174|nr:hypothetical protein [Roseicyclus sp.]